MENSLIQRLGSGQVTFLRRNSNQLVLCAPRYDCAAAVVTKRKHPRPRRVDYATGAAVEARSTCRAPAMIRRNTHARVRARQVHGVSGRENSVADARLRTCAFSPTWILHDFRSHAGLATGTMRPPLLRGENSGGADAAQRTRAWEQGGFGDCIADAIFDPTTLVPLTGRRS